MCGLDIRLQQLEIENGGMEAFLPKTGLARGRTAGCDGEGAFLGVRNSVKRSCGRWNVRSQTVGDVAFLRPNLGASDRFDNFGSFHYADPLPLSTVGDSLLRGTDSSRIDDGPSQKRHRF